MAPMSAYVALADVVAASLGRAVNGNAIASIKNVAIKILFLFFVTFKVFYSPLVYEEYETVLLVLIEVQVGVTPRQNVNKRIHVRSE